MVEMTTSAPYYGDSAVMRTPPPDLPSLLLKERIVYLGLPLFSDDDAKRQMGIDVTELIIAQLLYLEFDNPEKPIYFYINSTGTSWYSGDAIGFETEAFAICDTLRYVKPPVHTNCIGQAMGTAAGVRSAGAQRPPGRPASLLHRSAPAPQRRPRPGDGHPDPGQRSAAQQAGDARDPLHQHRSFCGGAEQGLRPDELPHPSTSR